jgi:hypothetical protein
MVLQQLRLFNLSNVFYGQSSNFMFKNIVFQSDMAYSNSWLFGTYGNQLQNNLVISYKILTIIIIFILIY